MARKKKTPTPSEVELEIECLLSSWADALEIVHDGHKKYQAVLTKKSRYLSKKSKGCSPLTVEDNRILQDVSLKCKYDLYKKYYTLKTKLKKAKKDFESTPIILESSRRELAQMRTEPVKSDRAREVEVEPVKSDLAREVEERNRRESRAREVEVEKRNRRKRIYDERMASRLFINFRSKR